MTGKRGEISVFLSLVIVCVMSLILGLVESARTTGARLYLEVAANSASASVMSQYNRNLWDMYHLLFLETESDTAIKQSFASYLGFYLNQENWFPMEIKEVNVIGKSRMTERGGAALEQEILSYVKYRLPEMGIDFTDIMECAAEQAEGYQSAEDVLEEGYGNYEWNDVDLDIEEPADDTETDMTEDAETEMESEVSSVDWEKVRAIDRLEDVLHGDLLALVLPDDCEVSKNSVNLRGIPSSKKSATSDKSSMLDQTMINEYCLLCFDSFLEPCERKEFIHEQPLRYEQEYLLCGNDSDRENLKETVEKLLAMRETMNFVYLVSTPEYKAQADGLAAAVSGGFAPIQVILSVFIMGLWAFGESICDVKILLEGGTVSFWKENSEWKLELDELLELEFLNDAAVQEKEGNDYEDYLRVLFFLMNRQDRNYRMMDVIQWNVQTVQENFLVSDCVTDIEIQTKVLEQHLFFRKNQYERSVKTVGNY